MNSSKQLHSFEVIVEDWGDGVLYGKQLYLYMTKTNVPCTFNRIAPLPRAEIARWFGTDRLQYLLAGIEASLWLIDECLFY